MKTNICYIVLMLCITFSNALVAQVKKGSKRPVAPSTLSIQAHPAFSPNNSGSRKIIPINKKTVWVFGTNEKRGHFETITANDKKTSFNSKESFSYPVKFNYAKISPNVTLSRMQGLTLARWYANRNKGMKLIYEKRNWFHDKNNSARNLEGLANRTTVHFFKNIKKKEFTSFADGNDHIIVTDTLYAPASFMNVGGDPGKEVYNKIKIIANYIVYENPIRVSRVRTVNRTDYIFSAENIIFKSPYRGLGATELTPPPPLVIGDINLCIYEDGFDNTARKLMNHLFIGMMAQISTELNGAHDEWERDKLLSEFQTYRYRVRQNILLADDITYRNQWNKLCNDFDARYDKGVNEARKIGNLTVIVEGKVKDLHKTPFKYYALPTKATLIPVRNEATGAFDRLGAILFKPTGDSKLSLTMEVELGYDEIALNQANQQLKTKGLALEKHPPVSLLHFDHQPLRINGLTNGNIVPISNQLLRLEMDLPDENLSLIKLFPQSNNLTFNLTSKLMGSEQKFREEMMLKVPHNLLKASDYEHLINKFNVIESNTIIDHVKISSQLSPILENEEGALNYITISLAFLFDDKKVFRGPFNLSSYSTHASELSIPFVKHSEDYQIKVTGTAFYIDGKRDIADGFVTDSKFIILEEGMFKTTNNK